MRHLGTKSFLISFLPSLLFTWKDRSHLSLSCEVIIHVFLWYWLNRSHRVIVPNNISHNALHKCIIEAASVMCYFYPQWPFRVWEALQFMKPLSVDWNRMKLLLVYLKLGRYEFCWEFLKGMSLYPHYKSRITSDRSHHVYIEFDLNVILIHFTFMLMSLRALSVVSFSFKSIEKKTPYRSGSNRIED